MKTLLINNQQIQCNDVKTEFLRLYPKIPQTPMTTTVLKVKASGENAKKLYLCILLSTTYKIILEGKERMFYLGVDGMKTVANMAETNTDICVDFIGI